MAKNKKFSMAPSAGEEGLIGNCDATISEAVITTWSEAGENALAGGREAEDPAGKVVFTTEDGKETAQFFSAGKATRLVPSEDGEEAAESGPFIIPAEDSPAKGLSKNSNLWLFLNSLCKPPEGKLKLAEQTLVDKGMDALVGLKIHLVRVPAPNQGGGAVPEAGARERTILLCNEIYEIPGKGKPGPKKKVKDEDEEEAPAPKKGKAKPAKEEAEGEDEVKDEAQAIVVAALEKAGEDGIEKSALVKAIFAKAAKSANRKAIIAMVQEDEFLTEGPWTYDEESETLTSLEE